MRHVFLPATVIAGPQGMSDAAAAASLIAPAGCALGMTAGLPRAAVGAVDLAVVAAPADQHLNMAPGA
jgi:hypothetical protein